MLKALMFAPIRNRTSRKKYAEVFDGLPETLPPPPLYCIYACTVACRSSNIKAPM